MFRMSSSHNRGSLDGQESASDLNNLESNSTEDKVIHNTENMSKRVAAKELIVQYYYQLTEGCGNEACSNENCASSNSFRFRNIDRNKLAVEAITLSKAKAHLCERRPSKVSRLPAESEEGPSGHSASAPPVSSSTSPVLPSTSVATESTHQISYHAKLATAGEPVGLGAKSKVPSPTASSASSSASFFGGDANVSGFQAGKEVKETPYLTEEKLNQVINECQSSNSWSKLIHLIGSVFNNPDSLILSFRKTTPPASCNTLDITTTAAVDIGTVSPPFPSSKDTSVDQQSPSPPIGMDTSVDPEDFFDSNVQQDLQKNKQDNLCSATGSTTISSSSVCDTDSTNSGLSVDLSSLRRAYQRLLDVDGQPFQGALINALLTLSHTVEMELKYKKVLEREPHYMNVFVIIMEIPMLHYPEYLEDAFPCVCKAVGHLPISGQAELARIWAKFGAERLKSMVESLQQMITVKVINNEGRWSSSFRPSDDLSITSATKVLKILYYSSLLAGKMDSPELVAEEKLLNESESLQEHMQGAFGFEQKDSNPPKEDPLGKELGVQVVNCREPLIAFDEFINEPLNENLDIGVDYTNYRLEGENKFSFVPYSFILTTASKHTSMYFDNRIRMLHERRTAFVQTLVHGGPPNPFLRVRVRRDHLIEDALVNLEMIAMENPSDLRKQLFVEFEGEQGLDEGGVSKEFFQLIVEELFNPDIGMFTYNEQSHHFWFNSMSFENDAQFTLIGILLGLAIYNSCILDIHFPMVVYRKLMGKKGTFTDLYDVDPTLMSSLKDMLEYEGDDLQDVFGLNFQIGYSDVFGHNHTYDLKEGGINIPVTQENKQEFVDLYADYLLNKSIEQQFRAFKRGFLMVTSESPLRQLFRPEEIELLVCGSEILDFHALEQATEYDGGFTEDSPTIKNFWTVVHELPDEEKKKLLQFTTGTDRVPVGGLSKLKMIIARNGPDSDRLPTSHTCFNVLLMPEYPTVEKMKDRLLKAINYSKGFGML